MDVFVIDTGLDTSHIEFARSPGMHVRTVKNLFDAYSEFPDSPSNNTDGEGHGTHVAGTVRYSTAQYACTALHCHMLSKLAYLTITVFNTFIKSVCKVCSCYISFIFSVPTLSFNLRYFHYLGVPYFLLF